MTAPGAYAEQRVLGILLGHPELLDSTQLHAVDFGHADHRLLFGTIREHQSGDLLVLAEALGEDLGAYAAELAIHESFVPENLPGYVRRVRECAEARSFAIAIARLRPRQRQQFFPGT